MKTTIKIKPNTIVVMVGSIGTGKSTLAKNHFLKHHIVETDFIREQLTGNFENQDYNSAIFEIFYATLNVRAKAGLLTVLDSTGNQSVINEVEQIAKKHKRHVVVLKLPHLKEEEINEERMKHRMKYIQVYHSMVERIDKQVFPKTFDLYTIDDINDVSVDIENERDKYTLDPQYKYVVIPDIHGEHHILEEYAKLYPEEDTKFILLGDLVDRGTSSYKTFQIANNMIKNGNAFAIISNHDNKLKRYFEKWLRDSDQNKYFIDPFLSGSKDYGMQLSHGLRETVKEFFEMHMHFMSDYATEFIEYYNNASDYLYLEKDDKKHFFAHAGITGDIIRGMPITKRDASALLYETITKDNIDSVVFGSENVVIHVGHDHQYDIVTEYDAGNGNSLIKHDLGIGKRKIDYIPTFYVIG